MNESAITVIVPEATYPEYRLLLVWRADKDGNGIRCYLEHHVPGLPAMPLQTSFHPFLNVLAAAKSALTNFFEGDTRDETEK